MASTTSTSAATFNFTSLPAEIRREIFLKYFEDPCKITFSRHWDELGDEVYERKFSAEARIALTNKCFLNGTVEVLKISPHTILEIDLSVSNTSALLDEPEIKAFAMHTRTISTTNFFRYTGFSPYRRLAPNLTTINVKPRRFSRIVGDSLRDKLLRSDLRAIVSGQEDAAIVNSLREDFERNMNEWHFPWSFDGLAVTFPMMYPISLWTDIPYGNELRKYNLVLKFKVAENKTTIIGRSFREQRRGYNFVPHEVEATEESMDSLMLSGVFEGSGE